MNTPESILQSYFGHGEFRPGQRPVIDALLEGRDALGIMPTGAGKSLCYQVPGLLMGGISIVISPLLSLMKDQVNALTQQGVPAAYLNSSLTAAQYARAMDGARAGQYKIIYVAPERLLNEGFLAFAQEADIALVTVDEAHCVSQWGQDFRPSYTQIPAFLRSLPRRPVLAAFTATANARVREDIVDMLEMRDLFSIVTGYDRPNLSFEVRHSRNKDAELLHFLDGTAENGVVYCATRKTVESVCELLCREGYAATRYHAGLPDAERQANQEDFVYDRKRVMVATNAFGMGIDKPDVRFVVHYNMPRNLESYYQEAGRAGRDGDAAACVLLYAPKDVQMQKFLIEKGAGDNPDIDPAQRAALREKDLEALKQMTFYCHTTDCLRGYILRYFGEDAPVYCGNCGSCKAEFEERDVTVEAQKIISCVLRIQRRGLSFGKGMVANVLRGSKNERIRNFSLDTLSTYGIMSDVPMRILGGIIDYLVREGFLDVDESHYDVLRANARSMEVVRGEAAVSMKLPKQREPIREVRARREKAAGDLAEADLPLFERLRALRMELAKTLAVPAYVVFTDASLRDMCRRKPVSMDDFLEVSGVGKEKARRFGETFTGEIRAWVGEQ